MSTARDTALSVLAKLAGWRADDRDDWLRVGMALHSASPDLLDAWDEWSQQSEKYKPGECPQKWRGFKSGGGIGVGSLVNWARQDSGDDSVGKGNGSGSRGSSRPVSKPGPASATETATPPPWERPIEDTYDYEDEHGKSLYRKVKFADRLEPRFLYQHPAGGEWKWGRNEIPVVPFKLPELLATEPAMRVYLCEGEKDVLRLQSLGLVATTNCGGAKHWGDEHSKHLKGRRVAVMEDNDNAGRARSIIAPASLWGVASGIKVIALPGLDIGGDVSDWLDAGGTLDQLLAIVEEAPEWAPPPQSVSGDNPSSVAESKTATDKTPPRKPKRKPPQVPVFQPFPVDILPEPLRGFVSVSSTAIGCDPSYVVLPLLAGLASAIGNTHRIQLKRGWCEPSVLWCAIVGESGSLKSPAIDAALGRIRQRQAKALSEFKKELDVYEQGIEVHKADMSEWRKSGHKDGEPLPLPPDKPTSGRCWCSDTTIEALAGLLDHAPRGLLVIRDELSGWLRSFDAYRNGKGADVAHYLEMHRAGHLLVDRKTGDRATISVPHAAVSIIGGIQPETLRRALGEENFENGLAARFLMTMPPRRTKRWRNATLDRALEDRLNGVFDWLFSLEAGMDEDGEPRPTLIPLAPGGLEAWVEFYNDFAIEQSGVTGALAAAESKLEGCAGRLALMFHLVRCATGELDLGEPIDELSVSVGVSLVRWFVHETKRVYAILSETDEGREIRQLVELVRRKGGRISVRELQRSRSHPNSDDAEAELAKLVEAGIGTWESVSAGAGGGRPSKYFTLTDPPDTDKTPSHDPGSGGFVSVRSGDEGRDDDWGVI